MNLLKVIALIVIVALVGHGEAAAPATISLEGLTPRAVPRLEPKAGGVRALSTPDAQCPCPP